MRILAGRASILGDTVMVLPLLNVLNKLYKNPIIDFPIAPKCVQAAPLYLFDKRINSIIKTQNSEYLTEEEWGNESKYDLIIDCFPKHPREQDWYNYRDCISESILMCGERYYEVFKTLPEDQQKPKLNRWWDNGEINKKTIAIHTTAGYSQGKNRSPSYNWWFELVNQLKLNFEVKQFGHPNDERIGDSLMNEVEDYRNLSLFSQVQEAVKCEYYIGTDSGFSHIMGALGISNQINLLTMWENNHTQNPLALAPPNCNGNEINLFAENGCSNIKYEDILKLL